MVYENLGETLAQPVGVGEAAQSGALEAVSTMSKWGVLAAVGIVVYIILPDDAVQGIKQEVKKVLTI